MTKNEQYQKLLRYYKDRHGAVPVAAREVAEWAVEQKLLPPPAPVDPMDRLAEDLAKAFREETRNDESTGLPYRVNHAVTTAHRGQQRTLWGGIDDAPRGFMQKAFTQRREQIVGDCYQLTLDLDHFNSIHPCEDPIIIPMDFAADVEERKLGAAAATAA